MTQNDITQLLTAHKPILQHRYDVTDLALFGSTARDTATAGSDIDILVAFDGPATSKRYFGVLFYLEDCLGRPVDLVTDKALRDELRAYISAKPSMSEPGNTPREWRFYLDDMIAFAGKVRAYTRGMTQAEFVADERTYDATLRNLALIGEAAGRIPEPIRSQHSDVPWRLIIATRNRLIHAYLGIDDDTVWSIIQDDVPQLLQALIAMRHAHE